MLFKNKIFVFTCDCDGIFSQKIFQTLKMKRIFCGDEYESGRPIDNLGREISMTAKARRNLYKKGICKTLNGNYREALGNQMFGSLEDIQFHTFDINLDY